MRKTSSRVILQIQDSPGGDSISRQPRGSSTGADNISRQPRPSGTGAGPRSSSLAASCDTLFIILALAVFLSIVGMIFVHRMFVESSAANNSLLNQEMRGQQEGGGDSFFRL